MSSDWTVCKNKSATSVATSSRAARSAARLARDHQELQHSCLSGIAAAPVGDDMFTWVATISPTGPNRTPFHLVLRFGELYPQLPPEVRLCTPIPHRAYQGPGLPLCASLLEAQTHGAPFSGWSSAFSVSSLLLQLQSFLFDPELLEDGLNGVVDFKAACKLAKNHACSECEFGPVPEFLSKEQLIANHQRRIVRKPAIRKVYTKAIAASPAASASVQVVAKQAQEQAKEDLMTPSPAGAVTKVALKRPEAAEWVTVKGRNRLKTITNTPPQINQSALSTNLFDKLSASNQLLVAAVKSESAVFGTAPNPLTKSAKKNARRRQRALEQKAQKAGAAAECDTVDVCVAHELQSLQTQLMKAPKQAEQPQQLVAVSACGLLDLPERVLVEMIVLPQLTAGEVGMLAQTCKQMQAVCECGEIWKDLFHKHCPDSELTAAGLDDWKHAYCCQVTSVMNDLRCFHSKASFDEAILGFGVTSTTNPRTGRTDYIDSTFDVLSYDAYKHDKVRHSVWKESFDGFLPLFIDADHFNRSLPVFERAMVNLCPQLAYRGQFCRNMVLEVIPAMMVTQMVLIADKGKHCSEKALEGYCQLHRLLLAAVECYRLQSVVEQRLSSFLSSEKCRTKDGCPAMGQMYALLSVSEKYTWQHMHSVLMQESFDRAILWVCKTNPALARMNQPDFEMTDDELLEAWLAADRVRLRISMYSVLFVQKIARPDGAPLAMVESSYDELYGRPSKAQRRVLQEGCQKILEANSWPQYFQCCWLTVPSKQYVLSLLRQALKNSARKKYHKPGMDFSRVQKSGVSKILLKGETYSCGAKNLRHVELQEAWGWSDSVGTIYLDASCLLFSHSGEFLEVIDYSRTHSRTSKGAVRHSGDVMDDDKCEGKHTISLDLHKLQSNVGAAYFTFTGFTTTLGDIKEPSMTFSDSANGVDLCTYNLDQNCKGSSKTAIIMCKLHRDGPAAEWKVTAIGHTGMGRATDYDPIIRNIANL